jgi:transcriptional regulator with XRE-family HTH domain
LFPPISTPLELIAAAYFLKDGCKQLKTRQIHSLTLSIANCNIYIAICNMKLGEKIRYLREVEGTLRGLERAMTQQEVIDALRKDQKAKLSQSYLSQIESGARPHLTNDTRMLLARFFKVHPGYLVDDPEGYHDELVSELRTQEDKLDLWLINGAERFRRDPEVREALLALARHEDSRRCLLLVRGILETPGLTERLLDVLKPEKAASAAAAPEGSSL